MSSFVSSIPLHLRKLIARTSQSQSLLFSIRNVSCNGNPLLGSSGTELQQGEKVAQNEIDERSINVKLDPFGIEEIASMNTSVLVQGFFEPEERQKGGEDTDVKSRETKNDSRLKIYDGWIKNREQMKTTEREVKEGGTGERESYRQISFGNIRLDSDNLVEKDGQFDQNNPPLQYRNKNQMRSEEPRPKERYSREKLTAHDFLQRVKHDSTEQKEKKTTQPRDYPTIMNPIQPRLVKRLTKETLNTEKFSENLLDPSVLDSNVVPKIYQFPDYNKLTSQDMWAILKDRVIFQNEFLLALNKPYGVPIHSPAIDCRHFITQFLDRLADVGGCQKVYPLHRLDKETSGVLIFAKDQKIATVILEKFANHTIEKTYLAITKLCPQVREGTIKIPIGEGKIGGTEKYRSVLKPDLRKYEIKARQGNCRQAITHFSVLSSIEEAAFLQVKLETGVKHQIRLHLGLGLGCPIIGDHKYSHRDKMAPQRLHPKLLHRIKVKQSKVRELPLHLHCSSIQFTLPEEFTKSPDPVFVHANVPNYFNHTLKAFGLK